MIVQVDNYDGTRVAFPDHNFVGIVVGGTEGLH